MSLRQSWLASMHHGAHHPAILPRQPGSSPASRRRVSDLIIATTIAVFVLASIIEIGTRWLAVATTP